MGNDRYLWPGVKILTPCAARTIILQRGNLNYLIVCFTWCTLFFQYDWFLLPICLPGVSCETYCNENKCCVVTHRAADSRVAWLVYVCTYCVPIATYGQRPNNKLLSGSFSTSCLYWGSRVKLSFWIRYTYPRTKKNFNYHDIIKNGLTSISEGWNPNLAVLKVDARSYRNYWVTRLDYHMISSKL